MESLPIAEYIKKNTTKDDKIVVLGSEPQIYFYSNRESATRYIYMFSLLELHPYALKMQNQMIKEVESAKPKYVVLVNVVTSWWARKGCEKKLLYWVEPFIKKNYELVGIADLIDIDYTEYIWGSEAQYYTKSGVSSVDIYKRKTR